MSTLRVQKRIVNSKRHTIGYIASGKRYTRGQLVKLARRNRVQSVVARQGTTGWYVTVDQSTAHRSLTDLPLVVE
jgi:hypothetical protein